MPLLQDQVYRIKTKEELKKNYTNAANDLFFIKNESFTKEMQKTSNMLIHINESTMQAIVFKNYAYNEQMLVLLSAQEIIDTFKKINDFGIHTPTKEEYDELTKIKTELSLKNTTSTNRFDTYKQQTVVYNNRSFSSAAITTDQNRSEYSIPFKIFKANHEITKRKNIMHKTFTKEFLTQNNERYCILISNHEEHKTVNDLSEKHNIKTYTPKDRHRKKINYANDYYLTNQGTWGTRPDLSDNVISFKDWFQLINELQEFDTTKLYKTKPYTDLIQQYETDDDGDINIGDVYTKRMSQEPRIQDIFSPSDKNYYTPKTKGHSYTINPFMCKEVTMHEFFLRWFNLRTDQSTSSIRIQVNNADQDKKTRNILSSFDKRLTDKPAIKYSNQEPAYYSTESTYGRIENNEDYNILPLSSVQPYITDFLEILKTSGYPCLDISINKPERYPKLTKELSLKSETLKDKDLSYLYSLPDGSFITIKSENYEGHGSASKYDSTNQDEFIKKIKTTNIISTRDMLANLLNHTQEPTTTIQAPTIPTPIQVDPLKIKNTTFTEAILSSRKEVSIQIDNEEELKQTVTLFRDYGYPYKETPKYKQGLKLKTPSSLKITDDINEDQKTTITLKELIDLELDNMKHQREIFHLTKKMKQFYIKEIEYKYYHNDIEVCKDHLLTQGETFIETVTGSAKRYFAAKDLGIAHDGLEEKAKRIMDQIKIELDSPEAIADKEHIILIGESGSGKTTIAENYFKSKNQPYVKQQGFSQLSGDDILGYISITNQEYRPSLLRDAVEHGKG